MSKLTLADLEYDLGRKQGGALATVVSELLARGRAGRRVLAAALPGRRAQLGAALAARAGQAVELLAGLPDFDTDPDSLALLECLDRAELGRKAAEMWDRGERGRAVRLARLVEGAGGHFQATLVLARELAAGGEATAAVGLWWKALEQGADFRSVWPELGRALEQLGRPAQAAGLYHAAFDRNREAAALASLARLLVLTLGPGDLAEEICQRVIQLAADHGEAAAKVLTQSLDAVEREAAAELGHIRGYLEELDSTRRRTLAQNRELLEETVPPEQVAQEIEALAAAGGQQSYLLTQHLMAFERFDPAPGDPALALREAAAAEPGEWALVVPARLPEVPLDSTLLSVAWRSLLAWTRAHWTGPFSIVVRAVEGGVEVTGQGEQDVEVTPDLRYHTAAAVFVRHRGRLTAQARGWNVALPGPGGPAVRAGGLLELLSREERQGDWPGRVTVAIRGLGAEGPAQLAAALRAAAVTTRDRVLTGTATVLAFLCHDIKNAFAFIKHWSAETAEVGVTRVHRRIDEHLGHITDWLDTARAYINLTPRPEFEYLDLGELVEAALARSSSALRQSGITVSTRLGQLPRLQLDAGRMAALLDNIILNACRAMPEGGELAVRMENRPAEGVVRLEFADTGPGIDAGALTRALAFPANGSSVDRRSLGLLTVKKIAEDHGAELRIESGPEGGTRITVLLPAGEVERRLAAALPGLGQLGEATRQALRAAAGLAQQPEPDLDTIAFLLRKALEVEIESRLLPRFERHLLLPAATSGLLSSRAPELAAAVGVSAERGFMARCQGLEEAIVRGRHGRELDDLRNLGLLVAGFAAGDGAAVDLGLPPAKVRPLGAALFAGGEALARPRDAAALATPVYRALSLLVEVPAVG